MEEKRNVSMHEFVAYYRDLRPEKFSDSRTVYEIQLTREVFENQLANLSTKKKHTEFENFIVGCAGRLITPNIKPQTGPDGGGDGKVDAETYEVSADISDKWYVSDGGAAGDERWAFAISCKKNWKEKVKGDVEKIIRTGRGYTRVLFFSNQFIKSSTRADVEASLSGEYGIRVEIFDGLWCVDAVFHHGCMDVALGTLNFSEEYKRKHEIEGSNDKIRKKELEAIEKRILRPVDGLDTAYVEELMDAYILSRGLELPRVETEGRFARALRECRSHGTIQQEFNITYDHAWTSFFWFEDAGAAYDDFWKLAGFVDQEVSVYRVERLTNILTNLINVAECGLYDLDEVRRCVAYVKDLVNRLDERNDKPSSLLYLRIYMAEQRLIAHLRTEEPIDDDIDALKPLLLEAPSHLEISFEMQHRIISDLLHKVIVDNQKYEDLLDSLTVVLRKTKSEQAAAQIEYDRAMSLMDNGRFKDAIRHLGFCIIPFEKEECMTELVRTLGMMGIALYEIGLPYSAEAYLIKSISLLLKSFYADGNIPHLLLTLLQKLCEIELMLGRIVMFLNWYELMMVVSNNGNFADDQNFIETNMRYDGAWACRFAAADMNNPVIEHMPDVMEREGLYQSSEYLKFVLGYEDDVEVEMRKLFSSEGFVDKMRSQPVMEQFLCDLNISSGDKAELMTTVNSCRIYVEFDNSPKNQLLAEIILASLESLLATMERFEVLTLTPDVRIKIVGTEGLTKFVPQAKSSEYLLKVNDEHTVDELWNCIIALIVAFLARNSVSEKSIDDLLKSKHEEEKIMDRIYNLLNLKQAMNNVLGTSFKNKIEDWYKDTDRKYPIRRSLPEYTPLSYGNAKQQEVSIRLINEDMMLWDDAGWSGCGFVMDTMGATPSIFGPAFRNIDRGRQIVAEWKDRWTDECRPVSIFIIRGIDKDHPAWYRVCISPYIQLEEIREGDITGVMCRNHTVTPQSSWNLDNFEQQYKRFGGCWLIAFGMDDRNNSYLPDGYEKDAFKFMGVEFWNAWEIGIHDVAREGLSPDDNLYIPEEHIDDAPVLEVIEEMKRIMKRE